MSGKVARFMNPALFSSHPPNVQTIIGIGLPIVAGLIGGILLVVSEPIYLVYSILMIAAGYLGGREHLGAEEGALRGFTGGILFGTFILFAKELSGSEPKAELPHPEVLLVVITTVFGVGLGALGGRSRGKQEARASGVQPA